MFHDVHRDLQRAQPSKAGDQTPGNNDHWTRTVIAGGSSPQAPQHVERLPLSPSRGKCGPPAMLPEPDLSKSVFPRIVRGLWNCKSSKIGLDHIAILLRRGTRALKVDRYPSQLSVVPLLMVGIRMTGSICLLRYWKKTYLVIDTSLPRLSSSSLYQTASNILSSMLPDEEQHCNDFIIITRTTLLMP